MAPSVTEDARRIVARLERAWRAHSLALACAGRLCSACAPLVFRLFAPNCLHGIEPGGADGGDQAGDEAHSMISLVGAQDNVSSIAKSHLSLVMVNATAGFRPKPACAGGSSNSS